MRPDDPLELHKSYRRVFETPDGRRVLKDLEARSFVRGSSFAPDPGRMAFNEGRRSMSLHVRHMLDPDNFNPNNGDPR